MKQFIHGVFLLVLLLGVVTCAPAKNFLDDLGAAIDKINDTVGSITDKPKPSPAPPPDQLFADDFARDLLGAAWKAVDDPFASERSDWRASKGALLQRSNVYRTDREHDFFQGTHIVAGSPDWRNYQLSAQIAASDDDGIGAIIRYNDAKNYYRFIMCQDGANGGPFQRLEKFVGGTRIVLAERRLGFSTGKTYDLRVSALDNCITVYLNQELALTAIDDSFTKGKIGFLTYANPGFSVTKVRVTAMKAGGAGTGIVLNSASSSALLVKEYPKTNCRITLGMTYRSPGVIIDTVGINAAPAGSFTLSVDGKGQVTFQVYAPGVQSSARIPNGWHLLKSSAIVPPNVQNEIIIDVRAQEITLWLNGKVENRLPISVALSGQPVYAGDFPGDDHWGSKYNIHPAMTGILTMKYCGLCPATSPAAPAPPAGDKPTLLPVPTDTPATVEAGVKQIEAAFRAGNMAEILKRTTPEMRARYQSVFEARQAELPRIATLLATRKLVITTGAHAEFSVTSQGRSFPVYFERIDTVWCLAQL